MGNNCLELESWWAIGPPGGAWPWLVHALRDSSHTDLTGVPSLTHSFSLGFWEGGLCRVCCLGLGPGALPGYGVRGFLPFAEEGGCAGHGGHKVDDGQSSSSAGHAPTRQPAFPGAQSHGHKEGRGPSDWTRFVLGSQWAGSPSLMLSIVGLSEEVSFGVSSLLWCGFPGATTLGCDQKDEWSVGKEQGAWGAGDCAVYFRTP